MADMKKITAFIPVQLLKSAQDYTGAGVSETLRQALQQLAHAQACRELLALEGKVHLDIDLDALREDREFDAHGNVL
jgi:hypothetical protein